MGLLPRRERIQGGLRVRDLLFLLKALPLNAAGRNRRWMGEGRFQEYDHDGWTGEVRRDLAKGFGERRFKGLREEILSAQEKVLAKGRHRVVVLEFETAEGKLEVAVKAFGKQSGWKDRYDRVRGSKASRSFAAACFLQQHEVGTPAPFGYFDRWEGGRLVESYYVSEYLKGLKSVRDELKEIYQQHGPADLLVGLLEKVGTTMKRMHDAGFCHRDLGNQNMEMTPKVGEEWGEVNVIDLNRGRIREELGMRERALDFGRLIMPSAFLEVLVRIYWGQKPPAEFRKEFAKARRRFEWWTRSRRWRHPIQTWRRGHKSKGLQMKDVWIWDRKSAQASITLERHERKKCQSLWNHVRIAGATARAVPGVWREYRRQMSGAFTKKVKLEGRIGMSLELADLEVEPQIKFLEKLGKVPVLLRFGHHEGREQWERGLEVLDRLHGGGVEIMVALLQDRDAVLNPESWYEFLEFGLGRMEGKVAMVEICHVVNRVKWGVHSLREHADLLAPLRALRDKFPGIRFSGPACIDFEYHYLLGGLATTPKGFCYDALSHHLYVDRRGAPENKQGSMGTVEKAGLLKAIARWSGRCEGKVIVSEVNWPLEWTGEWSPVSATYQPKNARGAKVHITEEQYGYFMLRYLVLTLCSGFVDQVYWWRLVAHGFGLIDERADGGWRERIGFQMLCVFLEQLGTATFVKKLETEEEVYALRFERENDEVTMMWCNGRIFTGPWPSEFEKVLDASGEDIELEEVGDSPVYLLS